MNKKTLLSNGLQMSQLLNRSLMYKQAALEKEAITWRQGLAGGALMAHLLNALKGMADEGMVSAAKELGGHFQPQMIERVENTISNLGPLDRLAVRTYGIDGIAQDMAAHKANIEIAKRYNLPIAQQGEQIGNELSAAEKAIKDTGELDINHLSSIYDKLKEFNTKSEADLLKYIPRTIASK